MTIYAKIAKAMAQVERVPKTGYNSFHKYAYATETDLTESIRPILTECGLAFFSSVLEQEREGEFTKAKMEFTVADTETGECIKSTYWGEGQDKGDKGLYKAYTGATKYFLMKTFLIPTGDDPESDESTDKRNSSKPDRKPAPKNNTVASDNVTSINEHLKGAANEAQLKAVRSTISANKISDADAVQVFSKYGASKVEEIKSGDVGNIVKDLMAIRKAAN
jgi:hypothetical protein